MKIELREFSNLEYCKSFINNFVKQKEVINIDIKLIHRKAGLRYLASIIYKLKR